MSVDRRGTRGRRLAWPRAGVGAWSWPEPRLGWVSGAALLLVLALAVRVGYVVHTSAFHPLHDGHSYDYLAQTLARGKGWGYGTSAYRPPAYPLFLSGIYLLTGLPHHSWVAARLVEAVVATGSVALIGLMAWQIAGRTAALVALLIAAVYVPLVLVGVSLMTESLFVPLLLAATNCALRARVSARRWPWIVAAGVLTGLTALTRGNGVVVGAALALLVWTSSPRGLGWRRRLMAPVVLLVVMALTIAPWTIRNAYAQHAFVPVTTELGPTLAGTYNSISARERYIWRLRYPDYGAIKSEKATEAQINSRLTHAVLGYIARHPAALPEAMFWNTLRLLDLQGRRVSRMTARTDENATAAVADLGVANFWIVAALAIAGCATAAFRRTPRALWALPALLWLVVAPVTTGTPRFRAAIDPFVIVLAAFAVQALGAEIQRRRSVARDARQAAAPLPA